MKFRTEIDKKAFPFDIDHNDRILLWGSCFSERIGRKLQGSKFDACINPFGTVYNALSIAKQIEMSLDKNFVYQRDLVLNENNNLYNHYNFHSDYASESPVECMARINACIDIAHDELKQSSLLFVTLGTSYVYEHHDFGTVANCHKMSSKLFSKTLLSAKAQTEILTLAFEYLLDFNPSINIVLTVSPVRHTREGLENNALSKSILRLVSHNLCERFEAVHYLPAYEIVNDDLRDYRFFEEDLIHPNNQAVQYLWEYFSETFFSNKTKLVINKVDKISKNLNHKYRNPQSESSLKHQKKIDEMICDFKVLFPEFENLDFKKDSNS